MSDEVFTNKITADVSQFEIKLESAQKEMQAFEKALKLVESVKLKDPLSPNYNAQLELANRNLAKTKQELLAAGEAAQKTKTHISGLQSAMSALSAVGIGKMLLDFAKKAQEASVWDTKLNAVLESTKGVSGMTKQSLDGLTKSLHESTGMSSNAIKEAEHMLLTFTNIGKDVFPKATESVLNLATAMGSDTKSAAIQLGKALNDPEKGITALHRVGVSFSAQQKEQIANFQKLGKTAEAQKVILAELDTEFGGLANAVGKNRNPMERMHELMENLEKSLGKVVLQIIDYLNPAFETFKSVITALMDSPFGKSALIITGIIAALVLIGITIDASVIPAVKSAINSFIEMWEALGGPVAWVITAIVAVGAGIYLLYTNCEWFRKGVQAVWEYIQMAWNEIYAATSILVESIVNYFTTLYNVAIAIFGGLGKAVSKAMHGDFTGALGELKGIGTNVAGAIAEGINKEKKLIHDNIKGALDANESIKINSKLQAEAAAKHEESIKKVTPLLQKLAIAQNDTTKSAEECSKEVKDIAKQYGLSEKEAFKLYQTQVKNTEEAHNTAKKISEGGKQFADNWKDAQDQVEFEKQNYEALLFRKSQGDKEVTNEQIKNQKKAWDEATKELKKYQDIEKKANPKEKSKDDYNEADKILENKIKNRERARAAFDKDMEETDAAIDADNAKKLKNEEKFAADRIAIHKKNAMELILNEQEIESNEAEIKKEASEKEIKDGEKLSQSVSKTFENSMAKNEGLAKSARKAMEQGMLDTVKLQILTLFPAILSQCISWLGPIAGPIAAGVAEGSIQVLISQASSMINRKEGGEHPATGITGLIRNPNSVTINRVEDGKEEYTIQHSAYEKFRNLMPIINSGNERQLSEMVINQYGHLVNTKPIQINNTGIEKGIAETNKRIGRLENAIVSRNDRIAVENIFSPLKVERGELTSHILSMKRAKLRHGA